MDDALSSSRFTLLRSLGSGGFGVVYEAYDHERGSRVALKKLTRLDATAIYRFKREFRALADLSHPNLVRLHELFCAGEDDWYFTMDLVDGVSFRDWVRASDAVEPAPASRLQSLDTLPSDTPAPEPERAQRPAWRFSEARLRDGLAQLAAGVHALHQAGKLHRDLKPSNVLVTPSGQAVVLDFGLVADLEGGAHQSHDRSVKGTPAYMSPEQANGEPVSAASDWYAVGAMLYEALVGEVPFTGNLFQVMVGKTTRPAPDPRTRAPDLPDDLADLCVALLARFPRDRPSGDAVLSRLRAAAAPAVASSTAPEATPFVGRERHLSALRAAWAAAQRGAATAVHVRGPSGSGKTSLARRFLASLGTPEGGALVLAGRCHAREEVPYKAFDEVVDALTQHLLRQPPEALRALLPEDAEALARLFPAFGRVVAATGQAGRAPAPDVQELRRRAFAALRETLHRLAAAGPLALFVDDLQWGDADSAALLVELLAPPSPPALLLVACYRTEDAAASEMLRVLRQQQSRGAVVEPRAVDVGPLDDDDARALVRALLGSTPAGDDVVAAIVRESGGIPLFVHELALVARAGGGASGVSLQRALAGRIEALPPAARRLLEVVAVAVGPIETDVARAAADLDAATEEDARGRLVTAHLLRTGRVGTRTTLEPLHEAIRDAVVAALPPDDLRARHAGLAAVLDASAQADPEALAHHLRAIGDAAGAQRHAERAGDRAAAALAFDRAAALYRAALEHVPPRHAYVLRVKLGDALAHAGRGAEAARAYLDAVPHAPGGGGAGGAAGLDLRRRAAAQFLRSGHVDEGVEALRAVLDAVGLDLPPTVADALASLQRHRVALAWRGLEFRERAEAEVAPADLTRIDVCWSVGNGLGGVEPVVGADFHARHVLLALDAGEPYRIARALAWEAILAAMEGGAGAARAGDLAARAEELAERIAHPHALGWAVAAAAVAAWCEARWRRAAQLSEYSAALFRERCVDIAWEVGTLETRWHLPALFYLGEVEELGRRASAAVREAEERGDRYALTNARTSVTPLVRLAANQPREARRESDEAIAAWSSRGWHLQHWAHLATQVRVDLYEGDGARAVARFAAGAAALEGSHVQRIQAVRIQTLHLRGLAALAAARAVTGAARRGLLRAAARDARRLVREKHPWADAKAQVLAAGVWAARGATGRAATALGVAAAGFDALDMALAAASARRARASLAGGVAGAEVREAAEAAMAARGVADPARLAALFVPDVLW